MKNHNIRLIILFILFLITLGLVGYFFNDPLNKLVEESIPFIDNQMNQDFGNNILQGFFTVIGIFILWIVVICQIIALIGVLFTFIHNQIFKILRECNKKLFLFLNLSPLILLAVLSTVINLIIEANGVINLDSITLNITILMGVIYLGISTVYIYIVQSKKARKVINNEEMMDLTNN